MSQVSSWGFARPYLIGYSGKFPELFLISQEKQDKTVSAAQSFSSAGHRNFFMTPVES